MNRPYLHFSAPVIGSGIFHRIHNVSTRLSVCFFPVAFNFLVCNAFQRDNNRRRFDIVSLIAKKRDGLPLEDGEIEHLVTAVSRNTIDPVQIGQ